MRPRLAVLALLLVLGACPNGLVGYSSNATQADRGAPLYNGGLQHDAPPLELDAGASVASDAAATPSDAGLAPDTAPAEPELEVQFIELPAQSSLGGDDWGLVLTDIAQHIPESLFSQYWFDNHIIAAHEVTHGIDSVLRNGYTPDRGLRSNGFYVLENRGVLLEEPNMQLAEVPAYVPAALQGDRYNLYLVQQVPAWNDRPTYMFDEFVSYTNSMAAGVDLVNAGLWDQQWTDGCLGALEFVAYSLAFGMAVKDHDPEYFSGNVQFRAFLGWQIKRAMTLYGPCSTMQAFAWQHADQFLATLRSDPSAEGLRAFVRETFGASYAQHVLGF